MLVASVCGLKGDRRLKQFVWEDFPRLSLKWHEGKKKGYSYNVIFQREGEGRSFPQCLDHLCKVLCPHSVLED